MALKKSDLYRSLWASCDELRGGMDASQYKDYILVLLFVKYVTDKAKADPNSLIDVPEGGSFDDLFSFKGSPEIGDKINKSLAKLAAANDLENVLGLADFNDEEKLGKGKEMQDRLSTLVGIFGDLDFSGSRAQGDDLLGDAYEYLMRHFATESGKSKGQFYTPAEVSRVLAKVVGIGPRTSQDETVYDPTCGSGSLLLKAADEAPRGMSIYGQEKDNATRALAIMNMVLHGKADAIDDIRGGDTITSPRFTVESDRKLKTFDYAVANPPFSVKSWDHGLEQDFARFVLGRPPQKNGDYAFLLHVLASLKPKGKAAIILPHGVLFRGNAEATIRKALIRRGYIKGVIGLPLNLFYGTGIPACIVVLDKENAQARAGIFMVDASKGFAKDGPKNRLRSRDLHKIVDVFTKQAEVAGYSRMVPTSEIGSEANDFNLNIPRYVDSSEPEDIQDLNAHIHGGIPEHDIDAMSAYWDAFPSLRATLFQENRPGYVDLTVDISEVQQLILDSAEFKEFSATVNANVDEWFTAHRPLLAAINGEMKPAELITVLGDDLLARFRDTPLLDEYAVYEQLLSYWHETMHDDVFLVMHDGWATAAKPRVTIEDKARKLKEDPDIVIGSGKNAVKYKTDLIPPALVVAGYLASEQAAVDALGVAAEEAARELEEHLEEHGGDEGLLAEATSDNGKVTKTLVDKRLKAVEKEIKDGTGDEDELAALQTAATLFKADAGAKKTLKNAQAELNKATLAKYYDFTEDDINELVLDAKWLGTVTARVSSEADALTLALVARIQELGGRYRRTVAEIETDVAELEAKTAQHLASIGVWG
jgi:type I restriction enzyme M protein